MTVICAWCKMILVIGEPETSESHGMCAACAEDFLNVKTILDKHDHHIMDISKEDVEAV